jgi:protein-L-isoaspartate(D-aspartate) O-methyltransferase
MFRVTATNAAFLLKWGHMRLSWNRGSQPRDDRDSADSASAEALVNAARAQGVTDTRVIDALRTVRREAFVPEEMREDAGFDGVIPIGHSQTTSQPSLIALMIEALAIDPEDTVLEVGTGYGYQTALLAKLAHKVSSVERIPELAEASRLNLSQAGVSNAEVVVGDGTLGLPRSAPFDGIVVSAAFLRVPAPLAAQLAPRGRLVMPLGNGGGDLVKLFEARGGELTELRVLCGARFVPLVGENGFKLH